MSVCKVGSQLGLPWMRHRALELPNLFEKAYEQNWLQIPGQTLGMVLPCMVEDILSQAIQIIQEAKVGEQGPGMIALNWPP